jgi:hypothetical protein
MHTSLRLTLVTAALLSSAICSGADISWTSGCAKITSVTNYSGYSKEFVITLAPGPKGCTGEISGVAGAIPFSIGREGVTDANFIALLETALTAYTSGHRVTVGYDASTGACYGMAIAVGGLSGDCP